jgi:hypothetical protein
MLPYHDNIIGYYNIFVFIIHQNSTAPAPQYL